MLRSWLIFLALALSVLRLARGARGQGESLAKPQIVVTPTAGFCAESLGELAYWEEVLPAYGQGDALGVRGVCPRVIDRRSVVLLFFLPVW